MADEEPAVSVVIPVATAGAFTRECLQTVLHSLESFDGASQLILVLNGLRHGDFENLAAVLEHPKAVYALSRRSIACGTRPSHRGVREDTPRSPTWQRAGTCWLL